MKRGLAILIGAIIGGIYGALGPLLSGTIYLSSWIYYIFILSLGTANLVGLLLGITNLILGIIINAILWILIGGLIGLLIQKIKNKK